MAGMKTLEENIARLESAIERAREAASEANSSAKAARDAKRELEQLAKDIPLRVTKAFEEQLKEHVEEVLASYADNVRSHTDDAQAHVQNEFKKLTNLMLYGNEKGEGEHVIEMWVSKAIRDELRALVSSGSLSEWLETKPAIVKRSP